MKSMTGFSRQERQGAWGTLTVEVRSVNHRFLEMGVRLPEELRILEPRLRERVGQLLARGKVDLSVRYQPPVDEAAALELNHPLAERIAHLSRELDAIIYNPSPVNSLELLRWPGILRTPEIATERLHQPLLEAVEAAVTDLVTVRAREGEVLKGFIGQRLDTVAALIGAVQERLPQVLAQLRERLKGRFGELQAELDPTRLEQELVLVAQRLDVAEELDRLGAHVEEVRRVIEQQEPIGRRLDFLMQEMNREANTLASKSADVEVTRIAVELKVLIEQMREQVQNIE